MYASGADEPWSFSDYGRGKAVYTCSSGHGTAGDIVRTTSVRRLNKLYFAYTDLSPEVQQAYKELIPYCGGVEDLLQKSEEFLFYPECHNIMDVARYRLEHNIEFSALSEKGKKYFNLEAYAHELDEKGRYAVCNNGMFKL